MGTLTNWSPIIDFTTTDDVTEWNAATAQKEKALLPWQQTKPRKPDRIFATCKGETNGAVVEYRYGLKASIGLDLEFGADMKQAWLLSVNHGPLLNGYLLLLAMADYTVGLLLPNDFSGATSVDDEQTAYDLSSTTLALAASDEFNVQVTKQRIVLVDQDNKRYVQGRRGLRG